MTISRSRKAGIQASGALGLAIILAACGSSTPPPATGTPAEEPTTLLLVRAFVTPVPPMAIPPADTPILSLTPIWTPTLTPTLTSEPTLTPTVAPTVNLTPKPTRTPKPTTVSVPPPRSGGPFELGGHVANFNRPDLMKYAGMAWAKRQIMVGSDATGLIADAHGKGFKILFGMIGDHNQLADPNYQQQFANYAGDVAAAGADGIEVENEMNLDREWPAGQISGASYVGLLSKAYAAIKAANPKTLVISGALSPTGYFGGCTPNGCDDAPYLRQMVAAGALNYADCVGVHYNEGILPPTATRGDPRGSGSFYTRYYYGMVNTYWSIIGGTRKLCFTELGYLSQDGYPPLSEVAPAFGWASNVTVQNQADWLAQAASLSMSGGMVRLMIVWNVDFTNYGADPQAGYAVIRPDGSCPACNSLGAVVGRRQ